MNKKQQAKLNELLELSNKLTLQLIAQSQPQLQVQTMKAEVVSYKKEVAAPVVRRTTKKQKDQFDLWFYFAALVMLFIKLTEITQIGWQGVFAPLMLLGMFKIKDIK